MKDFYPSPTQFSKLHKPVAKPMTQSMRQRAVDMTIRRPGVIRPGTLTGADEASAKKRYLNAAVLKRGNEPVIFNPQINQSLRGWERPADGKTAQASNSKPETFGGLKSVAAAMRDGNWRAFISSKHKKYTADRGVKVQPATFRLQSGIIVVLALVALATAKTSAPSGTQQPVATPAGSSQSAPMTPASSLQGSAEQTTDSTAPAALVSPSSIRSNSGTGSRSNTSSQQPKTATSGSSAVAPAVTSTGSTGTTGSTTAPAPTTTTPDPVVTNPTPPVVVPTPDPEPTPDPVPTDPIGGILGGLGGTLQSTTDGLTSIL